MPASLFAVASPHDGFALIDWAAVALYALAAAAIAWACSRKQGTTEEFFLGGRNMPWFAVGLSIMATLMSTISYLAVPGEMIQHGIGMFAGQMAVPLAMGVVLCLWVPFFMRLRLTSVYEYLEQRFGPGARLLAATLFILLRLGWLGVIIYTCSMAVDKMVQIEPFALPGVAWGGEAVKVQPLYLWIALIGIFTTAYTSVGGIRAVIWTDVMQSVIMFGGVVATISYVWLSTGDGPLQWWAIAGDANSQSHKSADIQLRRLRAGYHPDRHDAYLLLDRLHPRLRSDGGAAIFLHHVVEGGAASYLISAFSDITVAILLATSGLALFAFYHQHPTFLSPDIAGAGSADKWFPYFIAHQLPRGLGGLILAALFAAGMSSVSSGINSISAVGVTDIVSRFSANKSLDATAVARARWLSLVIGVLVTVLATGFARLAENPTPAEFHHEEEVILEQSGRLPRNKTPQRRKLLRRSPRTLRTSWN